MLKRISDSDRLLDLLIRYPGLTQRALARLHGIAPSLVYSCIHRGLVTAREQAVGHRSGCLHVFRLYITQAGREALGKQSASQTWKE